MQRWECENIDFAGGVRRLLARAGGGRCCAVSAGSFSRRRDPSSCVGAFIFNRQLSAKGRRVKVQLQTGIHILFFLFRFFLFVCLF